MTALPVKMVIVGANQAVDALMMKAVAICLVKEPSVQMSVMGQTSASREMVTMMWVTVQIQLALLMEVVTYQSVECK